MNVLQPLWEHSTFMAIVIDSANFKPADSFGLYRSKPSPFSPISAAKPVAPGEDPADIQARQAVEQGNAQVKSEFKQLESAEPGRYQVIDEPGLSAWQSEWQAKQPGWIEDTARILGGSVAQGAGAVVSGLGNAVTTLGNSTTTPIINSIFGTRYGQANPLGAPAEWLDNLGEKTKEGMSFATREAIANSTPEGDLLDPSTWSLGKAPSLAGYSALVLDVFGQMTPVIAAAVVAGPAGGAIVGGLQGGGAAGKQAEDVIEQMANEPGLLEKESAFYREQIAAGRSHDEAVAATKAAASQAAFLLTAPISGLGGFATSKIIDPATVVLQGRNLLTRISGKAGLSALEEGTQEAAESVAANLGVNVGAGTNVDLTEGTFGDFLLGALAGGGVGGIAGGVGEATQALGGRPDAGEAGQAPQGATRFDPATETVTNVDMVSPAQAGAPTPAPAAQRPGGVLTRAREHGIQQAGQRLIVNDPPLPGMGAGVAHGQTVTVSDHQEGIDPSMVRVVLEDGSERVLGSRLLQDEQGVPLVPDPQATNAPISISPSEPGLPRAGQRVIVEPPGMAPFNAQVEQFVTGEDGAVEAIVVDDDGEVLQVPSTVLRSLKLSPEDIEAAEMAENPPPPMLDMPEPGGRNRQLPNAKGAVSTIVFPDDTLAQLYDFGAERERTIRLNRATGESSLGMENFAPDRVAALAEALGVPPDRVNEIADDYRFRVQRAARDATAGGTMQMHGLNAAKLKAWQAADSSAASEAELDLEAPEGAGAETAAPAADDGAWWEALGPGARKAVLAAAGVKRSEKSGWDKFSKAIRGKLTEVRAEMVATDASPPPALAVEPASAANVVSLDAARSAHGESLIPPEDNSADIYQRWRKTQEANLAELEQGQTPLTAQDEADIRRIAIDLASESNFSDEADFIADRAVERARSNRVKALDAAANEAATSPTNDRDEPTQAQKEAGNYAMGHVRLGGLDLSIENPAGSERKGTDKGGKAWSVTMQSHYGYIRGTVGKDKDHIDAFVRPGTDALDNDSPVFVVDQVNEAGRFDEHKVMIGFDSLEAAQAAYLENYTKGWRGLGGIGSATLGEFKRWLKDGKTTRPFGTLAGESESVSTSVAAPAEPDRKRSEAERALARGEATEPGKPGPEFATFRAALPMDETGDPDIAGAGRKILDAVAGKGSAWAALSDSQKRKALAEAERAGRRHSRSGAASPVAVIDGTELGVEFNGPEDMPALRKAAAQWYDDHLVGTRATMADGTEVAFNKRGRRESTQGRKGDLLLRSVPAIQAIIEKGEVVLREPGNRPNVTERLVLRAPVSVLGTVMDLVVSVHRTADGQFQYDFNTDREAGGPGVGVPGGHTRQSLVEVGLEGAPDGINIGRWRAKDKRSGSLESFRESLDRGGLAGLVSQLEEAGRLRIGTAAELGAPDGVQGWTDPDGTITLIADQIDSDPTAVLLHEAFHSGAYDLLGSTQWRNLMVRLAGLFRQFETSKGRARQFFDAARERVEQAEAAGDQLNEPLRVEEFAAYAIEEYASAPAALAKWVDDILGAIKAWALKRFGRQIGAVTPAQLKAIAQFALSSHFTGEGGGAAMASRRKSIAAKSILRAAKLDRADVIDALAGKLTDLKPAMLATIPLNYFAELKRPGMVAVDQYLKVKRQMDAYRGEKHAKVDDIAQLWQKYAALGLGGGKVEGKTRAAALADLMHESTLAGVDPSQTDEETRAKAGYAALRKRFLDMPKAGQDLFEKVRDTYREQADEMDMILLDNVRKTQEISFRRAEDKYREKLEEIAASGMKGLDKSKAESDAQAVYQSEMGRATYNMKARMTKLRMAFEASRVPDPYFPLARFGKYFVTVRDIDGTVISFSKRESEAERRQLEREMRKAYPNARIESGLMPEKDSSRDRMDPRLVAEIETLLGDAGVNSEIMDAIWQRYLETMPDLSARKRFIHRKGIAGFDGDALRTFASNQFHAAHQMARLKFGLDLTELSNQAVDQAKKADDPVRGMQLANELTKRHAWVMNPTGSRAVQAVTSTMFTWYLAASPAAAIVNMSQTPMMGIPVLGARLGGVGKAAAAIAKASGDVIRGKGSARNAGLSAEEMKALDAFYESGMIERTQAHDLAGVGEVGVAYSPLRHKIMAVISWAYHNVEVWNREVTALAAYRLAREQGHHQGKAIDIAHELTWKAHFDYSNASRPRAMQGDVQKLAFVFMSHQVNMWYRLFRDIHQAVKGESPQARKESRYQLAGIMGMMGLFSGATGMFGYNVLMALAGLAFDDDDDPRSFKEEMEGHVVDLLGKDLGGIVLKGAPGHLTGIDLTSRLGMPDFFVRAPDSAAEGRDWFQELIINAFGVVPSTMINAVDGAGLVADGDVARGIEVMAPKFVKDALQAWRYAHEGVLSRRGDAVLERENLSPVDIFVELMGFTPAKISETYERMGTLKDGERRVMDERRELVNRFALAVMIGDPDARRAAVEAITAWNRKPYARAVPITGDSLSQSLKTRARNTAKREDGVLISDPELSRWLRDLMPERAH